MAALEGRVTSHVYITERDERHSLLHAACVHRYEMLAVREGLARQPTAHHSLHEQRYIAL